MYGEIFMATTIAVKIDKQKPQIFFERYSQFTSTN